MPPSDLLRDRSNVTSEPSQSTHQQYKSPRMSAFPESPTLAFPTGLRRVESSPPAMMGTPSPPLLPNHATLRVRKKRPERSLTMQDAVYADDIRYSLPLASDQDIDNTGNDALPLSKPKSKIPSYSKVTTSPKFTSVPFPPKDRSENVEPVYFTQLTNQDVPPSLQRRDSGKRKAFVRMIDGAKSKYPRITQRSLSTAGLLRRASTRSTGIDNVNWDVKHSSLNLDRPTQSYFDSVERYTTNRHSDTVPHDTNFTLAKDDLDNRHRNQIDEPPGYRSGSTPASTRFAMLSVQLSMFAETEALRAEEDGTFWVAIELDAVLHHSANPDGGLTNSNFENPRGDICDVVLTVQSCAGCTIETTVGPNTAARLKAHETLSLMVKVHVDPSPTGSRQIQVHGHAEEMELDNAFEELESMLGESLTSILLVECRYKHSLLPQHSEILVQDTCFLKRTTCGALWNLSPEDDIRQNCPHIDILHARLIYTLVREMSAGGALEELERTFTTSHPCRCPRYLDDIRRVLHQQLARDNGARSTGAEIQSLALLSPPRPLPRFSFEARNSQLRGLTEAFAKYPAHVILPLSGLKSPGTTESQVSDEAADRAQEIWRHIRNSSKGEGIPTRSADALKELQTLDKPLWEMRKQALLNKRSVGADTLKSLAASTRGFGDGSHAPWL